MSNLTITVTQSEIWLQMKGISFKSLKYTDISTEVIRSDSGYYAIDVGRYYIDGKTALVKVEKLVHWLKEIYDVLPYDGIKVKGHYQLTGEELYKMVIN